MHYARIELASEVWKTPMLTGTPTVLSRSQFLIEIIFLENVQ